MMLFMWASLFLMVTCTYVIVFWMILAGPARIRERVQQLTKDQGWNVGSVAGPISSITRSEKHTGKENRWEQGKKILTSLFARDKNKELSRRIQEQLRLAGMQITPEELIGALLICFFVPFVGGFLTGYFIMGFMVGMICSLLPITYVKFQQKRRMQKFNHQLHEMLTITSNSLKSGYSFLQSIQTIASEMPSPISDEFGRMIGEVNMGLPLEDALVRCNGRVQSQDFDLITTAIMIQRQIGGNLSEILDNIGETIRERVRIQGEIKSLTAQGRFSAVIFMILPPGVTVMIYMMNPSYISVLFEHPLGIGMVVGAIISQLIGFALIRKIVAIDV